MLLPPHLFLSFYFRRNVKTTKIVRTVRTVAPAAEEMLQWEPFLLRSPRPLPCL
jgi:hypothetical protein